MSKTASFSPLSSVAAPAAPAAHAPVRARPTRGNLRKPLLAGLGVLLGAVAAFYGVRHIQFALGHEQTDDAQVEGDISPVLPRVSGYVSRVLIKDNEHVAAGQPLLEIDARELDLKVAGAADGLANTQAALTTARATIAKSQAALAVALAAVDVAAVRDAKGASDLARDTALFRSGAITDRQFSDTRAAADIARAEHIAALRQADAARTDVAVAQAQAAAAATAVDASRSALDFARLQRSYAVVTAPMAGIVSRKMVEPGQYVQAGQTLLSVASDRDVWVVANFKETQLEDIRPGAPVEVTADTYPGAVFQGRVESIAGATGARFALLPPDNASGNYIKVTQRIPVKIVLPDAPHDRPLRPGMSVDAAVATRS